MDNIFNSSTGDLALQVCEDLYRFYNQRAGSETRRNYGGFLGYVQAGVLKTVCLSRELEENMDAYSTPVATYLLANEVLITLNDAEATLGNNGALVVSPEMLIAFYKNDLLPYIREQLKIHGGKAWEDRLEEMEYTLGMLEELSAIEPDPKLQ